MTNAEILITVLESLMTDGWKPDDSRSVESHKQIIEESKGQYVIHFFKEGHNRIVLEYCTDNYDAWRPNLTSWFVEYYDHTKSKETKTRLVAYPTNKQVRSFLSRLDKVQEFKATDYKIEQSRKELLDKKNSFVDKYMKKNCNVTEADIDLKVKSFDEAKRAIYNKVKELDTKYFAKCVDIRRQRHSSSQQSIWFDCDVNVDYQVSMLDWEKSYTSLLNKMRWVTSEVCLVTDCDFITYSYHINNIRDQCFPLISQLEQAMREALKTRALWNATKQKALVAWEDNK